MSVQYDERSAWEIEHGTRSTRVDDWPDEGFGPGKCAYCPNPAMKGGVCTACAVALEGQRKTREREKGRRR